MPQANTISTFERFPRAQPNMETAIAGLARVLWRYRQNLNTMLDSFVFEKRTKLIETPVIAESSFSLTPWLSIGSISDAYQIFDGNKRIAFKCLANDGFADVVVNPRLKSSLSHRQQFHSSSASSLTIPRKQ
jgi:hypothetical protein